ncbi:LAMI_0F04236g1_1 [Lachancea mirantina]|uniref:LAMI_0F04236g1_1 n=1 Tax=Lachancea mirantina TaxID=1230905 RepID=A0A1G4JXM7_9SACH|nr:LAMI_0F04236g1_1 [Lachancea mirantina]
MITRSPTRTKTKSFHGTQMDFKFPSLDFLPDEDVDNYKMSNHHIVNDAILRQKDDDNEEEDVSSQLLSDYTHSNSGHSSNAIGSAFYSFANISDNTTAPKTSGSNGMPSWDSNASGGRKKYPSTLAPPVTATPPVKRALDVSNTRPSRQSTFSHKNRYSASTAAGTIPTADNMSFQITFGSCGTDFNASAAAALSPNMRSKPTSLTDYSTIKPLRQNSVTRKPTNLKRSKAIRCKGGLLQFFSTLRNRTRTRLHRWRVAIRKKLFTYRNRNKARKSKTQTTSHLKRANGFVTNFERSSSSLKTVDSVSITKSRSLKDQSVATPDPEVKHDSEGIVTSPKPNKTSLRRSPSSIKRAASILTRANSQTAGSHQGSTTPVTRKNSHTKLVRSTPSRSLNAIVRQPSIVVSNKVIPLSKLNVSNNEFPIKEEDEDEYVINTHVMARSSFDSTYRSNTPSIASMSDQAFEDAQSHVDTEEEQENLENEKPQNSLAEWNHFLSETISRQILMRLQIAKFQEAGPDDDCKELIDAIISDYEEVTTSSIYDSDKRDEITSMTTISSEEDARCFSIQTSANKGSPTSSTRRGGAFEMLASTFNGSVKRSLTLPVGVRI